MTVSSDQRRAGFPIGASITLDELDRDPYPALARLREQEPVSWVAALDGWLVTRHDLVVEAMRAAATFTVDDPRFSTAQVVGPSMLSLDGPEHARHRKPFVGPFRVRAVAERFADATETEAARLIERLRPSAGAELRREFAGPLAAAIVARALGLASDETDELLGWYDAIVGSVTEITAGSPPSPAGELAYEALTQRLRATIEAGGSLLAEAAQEGSLSPEQIASNAAVILFGGIETTEGMIANLLVHLLSEPQHARTAAADQAALDAAIDESLRLEPAAAVIDRYATADTTLAGAQIGRGELVRLSLTAANRDPAVFADPDRFTPGRSNAGRQLAFAAGPH
ncbi:MAG: cytochrome P450, partial [Solirubrobacteraceae bacterium]